MMGLNHSTVDMIHSIFILLGYGLFIYNIFVERRRFTKMVELMEKIRKDVNHRINQELFEEGRYWQDRIESHCAH